MSMMQKTVQALQDNVEQTQEAAASKVHSHIHDNRILLEEMNSLRQKASLQKLYIRNYSRRNFAFVFCSRSNLLLETSNS